MNAKTKITQALTEYFTANDEIRHALNQIEDLKDQMEELRYQQDECREAIAKEIIDLDLLEEAIYAEAGSIRCCVEVTKIDDVDIKRNPSWVCIGEQYGPFYSVSIAPMQSLSMEEE